ncbi:MAG TPA: hypothetical protein VK465_03100 [Fibrobacteria bacterium]|nr:hypothetical protein [Fibrobacteria bacterium]
MDKARIIFFAALMGLAALVGAHHETTRSGASALTAHGAGLEAGSRVFVSTFPGASFALPDVIR